VSLKRSVAECDNFGLLDIEETNNPCVDPLLYIVNLEGILNYGFAKYVLFIAF
jgi:hypothetical protein